MEKTPRTILNEPEVCEYLRNKVVQVGDRNSQGQEILRIPSVLVQRDLLEGRSRRLESLINSLKYRLDEIRKRYEFKDCCGISAVQLGVPIQVSVIWTPKSDYEELVNPQILAQSDPHEIFEGCLSFFDKRGRVVRYSNLTLQTFDMKARQVVQKDYSGHASYIIQHEWQHHLAGLYSDNAVEILDYPNYLKRKNTID